MEMLLYLQANSQQTLKEAIGELRAFELDLQNDYASSISHELARDIDEHDAIHALFACTTNLKGEILAHVWTMFGTTMAVNQMHKVNNHQDHKKALKEIGLFKLLATWLFLIPTILRIVRRAKNMKKKFPISEYQLYLDEKLWVLRSDFGIII